jgi:hypothetical protein
MLELFKYTDKEIKELLSSMVVLVDSREQKNQNVIDWLERKNKPYITRKLDFGDYSMMLPKNDELGIPRDLDFSKKFVIERKQNISEFVSNLVSDRTRIEREFALCPAKIELIIENCQYKDIRDGNYFSKYPAESVLGTLHTWKERYDFNFTLLQFPEDFPLYMYKSFEAYLKKYVK